MKNTKKLASILLAGLAFVFIFAGCTPIEGYIIEVREKAEAASEKSGQKFKVDFVSYNGNIFYTGTYYPNDLIAPPPGLATRAGYSFDCWCKDQACEIPWIFSVDRINEDITLYAKWLRNYSVSFELNGGLYKEQSSIPPQSVADGRSADRPNPDPVKSGQVFGGWYNQAGDAKWDFSVNTVSANTTLYVKWIPSGTNFTINFFSDSGSAGSCTVSAGQTITGAPELSKTGYSFAGWYVDDVTFLNKWNIDSDAVIENTTLYAKWEPSKYSISFVPNLGAPSPAAQEISYNGKVNEPGITRSGFALDGWYKASDFSGPRYNFDDPVTSSFILYAKWLQNFIVTFDARGGSPTPSQQTVPSGQKLTTVPGGVTNGTNFLDGWYTQPNGAGSRWDFSLNTVSGNMTLYANWVDGCTVTFNANGGTPAPSPVQQIVRKGYPITAPSEPARPGVAQFDGWYTEASFQEISKWNFANSITGNITLTAKWIITPPGSTLQAKLEWMKSNRATSNSFYLLEVTTGHSSVFADNIPVSSGATNVNVTIRSSGASIFTVTLSSNGTHFAVPNGVTVTLENIVLAGRTGNDYSAVYINNGTLIMNSGATITGNKNASAYGGGVKIDGGTLTMKSGSVISNNSAESGGGVYISYGIFNMDGGLITGNNVNDRGGGVYKAGTGTFTMKTGATISANTAESGGAVYNDASSKFTMEGGTISGNTAFMGGGVNNGGEFTMAGGTISGNTAKSDDEYGGEGGGVWCLAQSSKFIKTGGTIYGSDGGGNSNYVKNNSNTVLDKLGHAVFARDSQAGPYAFGVGYYRDTTAPQNMRSDVITIEEWTERNFTHPYW